MAFTYRCAARTPHCLQGRSGQPCGLTFLRLRRGQIGLSPPDLQGAGSPVRRRVPLPDRGVCQSLVGWRRQGGADAAVRDNPRVRETLRNLIKQPPVTGASRLYEVFVVAQRCRGCSEFSQARRARSRRLDSRGIGGSPDRPCRTCDGSRVASGCDTDTDRR